MKREELENYEPKGNLKGFTKEIIARMLDYQEEQGNLRDVSVFERDRREGHCVGGFEWYETKEGKPFWYDIINNEDFSLFFEKYPKQDSQEFRVGDEVIDIITGRKGKIHKIITNDDRAFPIHVNFNETKSYTLDGRYHTYDKHPRLLHYRDDYNYDVIDFNNLPKRQEPKRWRAEKGDIYYSFKSNFKVEDYHEGNDFFSNEAYDSGNYFRTEAEAEIIAQKLNTYFKQLITKLI